MQRFLALPRVPILGGLAHLVCAALLFCSVSLLPLKAQAHPLVEQAREEYHRARFQTALTTLDGIEAASGLTRDDLVEALTLRLRVLSALGQRDALDSVARQLLLISPSHQAERRDPPDVRAAIGRSLETPPRQPEVRVVVSAGSGMVQIDAELVPEVDLVRALRIFLEEDGSWVEGSPDPSTQPHRVRVHAPRRARLRYYVEAVGPGSVVLFSRGSASSPLLWSGSSHEVASVGPGVPETSVDSSEDASPENATPDLLLGEQTGTNQSDAPSRSRRRRWPWIVATSVAAVAAAGLTTGLLLRDRDDASAITGVQWGSTP